MEGKVKKYADPYASSVPPLRHVLPKSIDPSSLIIQISKPAVRFFSGYQAYLEESSDGDGNQTLPPADDRQQDAKPDSP